MTQHPPNNKPLETIRDGRLKATIWKNPPKDDDGKGPMYSVRFTRTWRDEQGTYYHSDRFGGSDLLRIARLAHIAYDEIAIDRAEDHLAQQPSQSEALS